MLYLEVNTELHYSCLDHDLLSASLFLLDMYLIYYNINCIINKKNYQIKVD